MLMIDKRKTLAGERKAALDKAQAFAQAAQAEDRELSAEERAQIDGHLTEARRIKDRIDALQGDDDIRAQLSQLNGEAAAADSRMVITDGAERGARRIASLGEQFVKAAVYLEAIRGKARPRGWRSGSVELEVSPRALVDTATSGGLIVPQYTPGVFGPLVSRPVVGDLFAQGTTDSNAVIYMQESAATNGAAAVAEGAPKPESSLTFNNVTDLVKKIATWLGVTDEMLDDSAQLRSYLDSRLRQFVEEEEEDQLLNGDGLGPNITGIRNRAGLAPDIIRVGEENNADAIFRQIAAIATSSYLFPDAVVMNPADWAPLAMLKTTDGMYISGGPFGATLTPRLWGLPVVMTAKIPGGTALVGAFRLGGQVFRKGGIAVEASNSHADYFIRNLTAIRAEERLALAVYRPAAFGEVTSLLGSTGVVREGGTGGNRGELSQGSGAQAGAQASRAGANVERK